MSILKNIVRSHVPSHDLQTSSPPTQHEAYSRRNNLLRARLAMALWSAVTTTGWTYSQFGLEETTLSRKDNAKHDNNEGGHPQLTSLTLSWKTPSTIRLCPFEMRTWALWFVDRILKDYELLDLRLGGTHRLTNSCFGEMFKHLPSSLLKLQICLCGGDIHKHRS